MAVRAKKIQPAKAEAIENANQFQCEIIDIQDDNCPVGSVWDGWNKDWRKRNE